MTSMHRQFRVLVGILFILVLLAAGSVYGAPSANIIYVNHDAIGNNDGSSWTDAYTGLQGALGIAQAGDEIWVAQGVYYPAPNAMDRTATFELQDGVALYGGFAGQERERDERDWEANVTVLSGDLDRNDMTDARGVVRNTVNTIGDNAYVVVTGGGVTETAVLEGFTITAGKADGSWPDIRGGGMYNDGSRPTLTHVTFSGNSADRGGGMYNDDSSPTLTNVTFSGNSANRGGAICNRGSNPRLAHVTFTGNSAGNRGAGMYNERNSNPLLTNVIFSRNSAGYEGGGIYNSTSSPALIKVAFSGNSAGSRGGGMRNHSTSSNPLLTNVIFSGNSAGYEGGGMANSSSSPTLRNVTFSGNSAGSRGGGIYNWFTHSNPTLINCILWGNEASQGGAEIFNAGGSQSTISYSDIEGSGGSGAAWDGDLGHDGGNNIDANPLFVDSVAADEAPTAAGDYRLNEGSPAIDAGINDVVTVDTDLHGNPRIVDGTGDGNAVVDLGPYEFQIPLLTVTKQGHGLVTSTPDAMDCGNICTAGFPPGTVVTLTATPGTGWTFSHWSGDCTGTGTCQVTMDDDQHVTAHFTQDEYTLEIGIVGEGDMHIEPDQDTYHHGDGVTLTPAADPGWTFDDWSGPDAGALSNSGDSSWNLVMDDDKSLTATFTQDAYSLDVTVVGEGEVDIAPEQDTYVYGDVVMLTATADFSWTFDGWTGHQVSNDNPLTLVIKKDTTITATFAQDEYTLDVSIVGQGNVEAQPDQEKYVYGDEIMLTPVTGPGWTFDDWSGLDAGDLSDNGDGTWTLMMDDDKSVTATFTQDEYGFDVTIVGEGDVEVEPDQDTYHYGELLTITAAADPGWTFVGWSGDIESTDNPLELTVQDDVELIATFTQVEYTLEVAIVGEGEVVITPEQATYFYGDMVTLTATADPDWTFAGWSGDVDSTANPLDLTMEGDTTITATFEPPQMKVYLPLVLTTH